MESFLMTILGTFHGGDHMKRSWELDELIEHFTFLPNEMQQVGNKSGEMRLLKHGFPRINSKCIKQYFNTHSKADRNTSGAVRTIRWDWTFYHLSPNAN
ncbi:hypothetical protein VN24_08590 [Paenibacillus beijingensis]|uniref:Uncharacterized protein n=1 Tax=Paenibacillus beijingensis TaxID=1126833 RepID=A0A0D5NH97_9BACL|nr:hypothetical protein VN24_08590 [Paenibacillus beijingensis]